MTIALQFLLAGALLAFVPLAAPFQEGRWLFVHLLGAAGFALAASGGLLPARTPRLLLGGFLAAAIASALLASDPASARHGLFEWLALGGVALAASALARSRRDERRTLMLVVLALSAHAAVALAMYAIRPDGFFPGAGRTAYPTGLFGHKNHAGEAAAAALAVGVALAVSRWRAWPLALAMAPLALQLGLLRSRGAWIGAAVAGALVVISRSRRPARLRALAMVAGFAALVAAPNLYFRAARGAPPGIEQLAQGSLLATRQVETRWARWQNTVPLIAERPLLGHGPGSYLEVYPRFYQAVAVDDEENQRMRVVHAHDIFLDLAAEHGILGVALLASGIVAALVLRRRSRQGRGRMLAPAAGLASLFVSGITGYPLHVPATAAMFALFVGLLVPAAPVAKRASRALAAALAGSVALAGVAAFSGALLADAGAAAMAANDDGRAIRLLSAAVRLAPWRDNTHVRLAWSLSRQGLVDEAVATLDSRLDQVPHWAKGWMSRGHVLGHARRFREARASRARGCSVVPAISRFCEAIASRP